MSFKIFNRPNRTTLNYDEYWASLESLVGENSEFLAEVHAIKGRWQREVTNWQVDLLLLLSGLKAGLQTLPDSNVKNSQLQKIESLANQTKDIRLGGGGWKELSLYALTFLTLIACATCFGVLSFFTLPELAAISIFAFAISASLLRTYLGERYWERKPSRSVFLGTFCVAAVLSVVALGEIQSILYITKRFAVEDSKINLASGGNADFARKYLADNYGISLYVENAHDIWQEAYTLASGGSPAAMQSTSSQCRLVYSERSVNNWTHPKDPAMKEALVRLVAVHEMGHCATISPDFVNVTPDGKFTAPLESVPAQIATKISSIKDLEGLSDQDSQVVALYREVAADLFALGYAKLHHAEKYKAISTHMRDNRKDAGNHHTYCWMNKALDLSPPDNDAELAAWALHLAGTLDCSLEHELITRTQTPFLEDLKSYF